MASEAIGRGFESLRARQFPASGPAARTAVGPAAPVVPPEARSIADIAMPAGYEDAMVTVWEDGELVSDWTFAQVRERANATRL